MSTDAPNSPATARSSTRRTTLVCVALLVLAGLVWALRKGTHLAWQPLWQQFAAVSWTRVGLGIALIYLCFVLRAARWSVLLRPMRQASLWQLLPAQILGFSGVAIFGRVADLARPYLIARRTETPITTQIAVYSLERTFDLAAAATLFSLALAFAPRSTPHHHAIVRAGALSLLLTFALALIAIAIRRAGAQLARITERLLHPLLPRLAGRAASHVLHLQRGFGAVSSVAEFASAFALSLLMWAGIAGCYLLGATAFRATPQLAAFSLSATMLVMATGMGGSVVQLPVLGWFTQIALFAATLHALFGVPLQTATACATLIFSMTNLSVIPGGLLVAHLQQTSLRGLAKLKVT